MFSGFWALWRVEDAQGRVLREWHDQPDDMSDESDAERVALDLISNRPETQHYAETFGPSTDPDVVGVYTLAL